MLENWLRAITSSPTSPGALLGLYLHPGRQGFNKLQRLWSHDDIETRVKLKIYEGIFPHMVLYAMHHDWHTASTLNKMDAWHCKLLRRSMRLKTTYMKRSNTWVYQHANAEELSETINRRQIKYCAHIARHPDDIIHKVCFGPQRTIRQLNAPRRQGRPRQHWTPYTEQSTQHACTVAGRPSAKRRQRGDRKYLKQSTGGRDVR